MQGRSNARSARDRSDPYQVMSLKLCRSVYSTICRQASTARKQPTQFVRALIEREAALPPRTLVTGYATDTYVPVSVRVRRSTIDAVRRKADSLGVKPSQLIRAVLDDEASRVARGGTSGEPFRRAG